MKTRKNVTLVAATVIASGMLNTSAFAHHLWVLAENDGVLKAE